MTTPQNAPVVNRIPTSSREKWVSEAAARAEERSRGFAAHPTPVSQLRDLISAILDKGTTRAELCAIAKKMSGGGA